MEETLRREIRYLDKLIDELAKGKATEKILRGVNWLAVTHNPEPLKELTQEIIDLFRHVLRLHLSTKRDWRKRHTQTVFTAR